MKLAVVGIVVAGVVSSVFAPFDAQPAPSMTVFVGAAEDSGTTPRPNDERERGSYTKAEEQQHQETLRAANVARTELEKALKAQYGGKRQQWPAEAEAKMQDAEDAIAREEVDFKYRFHLGTQRSPRFDDAVQDIRESLVGKGMASNKPHVTLVDSPAEAQIVVEVDGRRTSDSGIDRKFHVRVRIRRGPKLTDRQFAAVPRTYRFFSGYTTVRLGAPPATPYWYFESSGPLRQAAAGDAVAHLIDNFIEKNQSAMLAGPA